MAKGMALYKEIDISNLQHLRDDGYSNAEIAKQLDVSTATVYRYLGANPPEIIARIKSEAWEKRRDQPERMRGPIERKIALDKPTFTADAETLVIHSDPVPTTPIANRLPTATLAVTCKTTIVTGVSGITYTVGNDAVRFEDEDGHIMAEAMSIAQVRQLVAELTTILRHADETNSKNQIWD